MFADSAYFQLHTDATNTEYIASGDEVIIVPLAADGNMIAIMEPSPAFGGTALVLPGGSWHKAEQPATEANRELQEEIGFRAGRLDHLGTLRPWAKYLHVETHVFLARDLTESRLPGDEEYEIVQFRFAFADMPRLIQAGELNDARVIAAVYLAQIYLQEHP